METATLQSKPGAILTSVAALTVLIAVIDWKVDAEVPLGFLYLLPMVVASRLINPYWIALLGALYTGLAEVFDGFKWSPQAGIPRDLLYFAAFSGIGLFNHQIAERRRTAAQHLSLLEQENRARKDAEEQLEILIESSPVAILATNAEGLIVLANDAAHRLFVVDADQLKGRQIKPYLPSLMSVPALRSGKQSFRTVMQCKGYREDGEVFFADVWFSTYRTSVGPRLAAMVVDTSEELRDREEAGLHQLLAGSRILVGAVSHEIRNVCGAIAMVHQNLTRCEHLEGDKDFEALGTLVLALEKIAAMELRQSTNQGTALDLGAFLDELRIVIGPSLREQEIDLQWIIPAELPEVCADPHTLMQVFLNLIKNSERALLDKAQPWVRVSVRIADALVFITVSDNAGGVTNPELIFRPFQEQAQATGLGLYLSRALMRSFGGDLHYEGGSEGAMLTVEVSRNLTPLEN